MNKVIRRALKPLFKVAAKPGISLPHADCEEDLMAAGVKPTAILGMEQITPAMAQAIENGNVILIGKRDFTLQYRIYYHPDLAASVQNVLPTLKKLGKNEEVSDEERQTLYRTLSCKNSDELQNNFDNGTKNLEMTQILSGEKMALWPIRIDYGTHNEEFEEAVKKGQLASADFESFCTNYVYAQADKIPEGKELFARYMKDEEGYEPLSPKDFFFRIGELLGYTAEDIRYADDHTSSLTDRAIRKIIPEKWRRYARREVMLADAPRYIP